MSIYNPREEAERIHAGKTKEEEVFTRTPNTRLVRQSDEDEYLQLLTSLLVAYLCINKERQRFNEDSKAVE